MSKIDVHHHVYPPVLTEGSSSHSCSYHPSMILKDPIAMNAKGGDPSGWFVPPWTIEADKTITDAVGVRIAMLSVTAPGPCIEEDPVKAAALARHCNEFTVKLRSEYPSRFGFFASLPSLLDTEATLAEIAYAFDTLHADGVTLFTRYGSGAQYLGNAAFKPIWAELNRRKAVVFVHPTHAADSTLVNPHLPLPMFDYPHETGKAAIDMITSGTIHDNPDVKVILSHAGGTLPYLIYRVADMLPHTPFNPPGLTAKEVVEDAKSFYFDTAISANPTTLKALFEFAREGHVLFGSDFPNAPDEGIKSCTEFLEGYGLERKMLEGIQYRNALALVPRLKEQY